MDVKFAYIDKRKAQETSYRAVITSGLGLEVCSVDVIDEKAA